MPRALIIAVGQVGSSLDGGRVRQAGAMSGMGQTGPETYAAYLDLTQLVLIRSRQNCQLTRLRSESWAHSCAAQIKNRRYSLAKTGAGPGFPVIDRISNGPSLVPVMPGEPSGIPGREMPLIGGFSDSRRFKAAIGTCPSTT
jgi:hypothetical protein